jgi:hypothetical protein
MMNREFIAGELVKVAKDVIGARVGDNRWDDMLEKLEAGKGGSWSFDGLGLRNLEAWLKSQGAKRYKPSSYFTKGPQVNYKLNGLKIQVVEGNFFGPFTNVDTGSNITPYLGD